MWKQITLTQDPRRKTQFLELQKLKEFISTLWREFVISVSSGKSDDMNFTVPFNG